MILRQLMKSIRKKRVELELQSPNMRHSGTQTGESVTRRVPDFQNNRAPPPGYRPMPEFQTNCAPPQGYRPPPTQQPNQPKTRGVQ